GQIVGAIYTIKEKMGTLPNGDPKLSLLAIGDFEATDYATGEVWTSTAAYLPNYLLETFKSILEHPASTGSVEFEIEIVIEPTGKQIPFAYVVRNLIQRRADSAVNRMKLALQASNRLRLPAPTPMSDEPVPGEVLAIANEYQVSAAPE